ncbi:tryptophan-rich sensory protein [Paenibacillus sp. CMAA1364]
MMRTNPYKWWNLISFLAMIAINALANTTLLGGRTTSDVSDMYPTYLTPAGYAFSIWSLIYILLAGFIYYQFRQYNAHRESVQVIGIWFTLSCIINIVWLLLWQYLYIELSVLAMIFLLLTLIVLYRRTRRLTRPTIIEYWLVQLPFTLYLSWISVATILNISIALTKNNWGGFGLEETTWAVIMLCVGAVLCIMVSSPYRDSVFPLVFVWAYIAIAMEQKSHEQVFLAACILSVILFFYSVWLFFVRNRDRN